MIDKSTVKKYFNIDLSKKESWGPGEWNNEVDYEEFEYKNHLCILRRGFMGQWLGYARISSQSKWAQKGEEEKLEVHGGITWIQNYLPGKEPSDEFFWLGFDCNHYYDYAPKQEIINQFMGEICTTYKELITETNLELKREYRTIDFARNELKKLVDQIVE